MSLLDEFEKFKVDIEGNQQKSLEDYKDDINRMFEFLGKDINNKEDVINITPDEVKQYLSYLAEKNNSASTRNRRLAAIKSFYKFLLEEKEEDINYRILSISKAKTQRRERTYLEDDQIDRLLMKTKNLRSKAIFTFLLSTGARVSDIKQITVDDVYTPKGKDSRGNDIYYVMVIGKGNKQRPLYFDNRNYNTLYWLRRYIDEYREKIIKRTGVNTNILFLTNEGNVISEKNLRTCLKRAAKKAGVEGWKEISPHSLRHTFATHALNDGVPIQVVRDALGHASIATTNIYAHASKEKVRELMEGNYE